MNSLKKNPKIQRSPEQLEELDKLRQEAVKEFEESERSPTVTFEDLKVGDVFACGLHVVRTYKKVEPIEDDLYVASELKTGRVHCFAPLQQIIRVVGRM